MDPTQKRLIDGFSRHGYTLAVSKKHSIGCEFRKPETTLRFVVKEAEGGLILFWTELADYDLMSATIADIARNNVQDVKLRTFTAGPEEFWQAVASAVEGN